MKKLILSLFALFAIVALAQPGMADQARSAKKMKEIRSRSLSSLEEDLKTLEDQNKAGIEELAQYKKDIADHTAEKLELQEKIEKAQAEKKRLYERVEMEKQQAHVFDNELRNLNNSNEKTKHDIKKLEVSAEAQSAALKKSREHLDAAQGLNKDITAQRDKLLQNISSAQAERKNFIDQTLANGKTVEALKIEMNSLKLKLKQATIAEAKALAAQKTTAAIVAEAKAVNQNESAKVQAKEDMISDLNRLIKAGKEELERAKRENEQLKARNQKAETDRPRLQMQAAQLKQEYQKVIAQQKGR